MGVMFSHYDKARRCPNWAGQLNLKPSFICDNGFIEQKGNIAYFSKYKLGKCNVCEVTVLPPIVTYAICRPLLFINSLINGGK